MEQRRRSGRRAPSDKRSWSRPPSFPCIPAGWDRPRAGSPGSREHAFHPTFDSSPPPAPSATSPPPEQQGPPPRHGVLGRPPQHRLARRIEKLEPLALADRVIAEYGHPARGEEDTGALIGLRGFAVVAVAARQQHTRERRLAVG